MYTFLILAVFFFLVSGVIFRKSLKQNQFLVILIVGSGTLIGTTIVNGVIGLKIPYTRIAIKTKDLPLYNSEIITPSDTMKFKSYIGFDYEMEKDSSIESNYICIHLSSALGNTNNKLYRLTISYLPAGDSIPRLIISKDKRLVESKWISSFGIPNGKKYYQVYIPDDSIHHVLMDQINQKFYKYDKEEIAKLN